MYYVIQSDSGLFLEKVNDEGTFWWNPRLAIVSKSNDPLKEVLEKCKGECPRHNPRILTLVEYENTLIEYKNAVASLKSYYMNANLATRDTIIATVSILCQTNEDQVRQDLHKPL